MFPPPREGGGESRARRPGALLSLFLWSACAAPVPPVSQPEVSTMPALVAFAQGVHAIGREDWAAARDHFARSVELDPTAVRPRQELGRMLLILGDHDAARRHLEFVREARPSSSLALLELAETCRRAGDMGGAVHYLQELHSFQPTRDEPLILLHAMLLALEREEEGVALFREIADRDRPDWAFGREALGDFLLRTGQTHEAERYYRSALELGGSVRSLSRKLLLIERKLARDVAPPSSPSDPGLVVTPSASAPR